MSKNSSSTTCLPHGLFLVSWSRLQKIFDNLKEKEGAKEIFSSIRGFDINKDGKLEADFSKFFAADEALRDAMNCIQEWYYLSIKGEHYSKSINKQCEEEPIMLKNQLNNSNNSNLNSFYIMINHVKKTKITRPEQQFSFAHMVRSFLEDIVGIQTMEKKTLQKYENGDSDSEDESDEKNSLENLNIGILTFIKKYDYKMELKIVKYVGKKKAWKNDGKDDDNLLLIFAISNKTKQEKLNSTAEKEKADEDEMKEKADEDEMKKEADEEGDKMKEEAEKKEMKEKAAANLEDEVLEAEESEAMDAESESLSGNKRKRNGKNAEDEDEVLEAEDEADKAKDKKAKAEDEANDEDYEKLIRQITHHIKDGLTECIKEGIEKFPILRVGLSLEEVQYVVIPEFDPEFINIAEQTKMKKEYREKRFENFFNAIGMEEGEKITEDMEENFEQNWFDSLSFRASFGLWSDLNPSAINKYVHELQTNLIKMMKDNEKKFTKKALISFWKSIIISTRPASKQVMIIGEIPRKFEKSMKATSGNFDLENPGDVETPYVKTSTQFKCLLHGFGTWMNATMGFEDDDSDEEED